jgi:hypothetical protein
VNNSAPGCSTQTGPCIDQSVFGPTRDDGYWSATTESDNPDAAWTVGFLGPFGHVGETGVGKNVGELVRAVRSGL